MKILKQPKFNPKTSLFDRALLDFVLWVFISGALVGLFFWIDNIDGTGQWIHSSPWLYGGTWTTITWAPLASICITIVGFNIAFAHVVGDYIKRHGRNVVSWVTAIILFSPVLAGLAYLLSWPKDGALRK